MTSKFEKYYKYGAYHWRWYSGKNQKSRYVDHVNKLKSWVQEKNTLDVGAGDGLITHVLGITGIDNEPKAVELSKKREASVELGDAHKTNFKDNEFESALLADALEHLEQPVTALREMKRIVRKYLYVCSPVISHYKEIWQFHEWTPEELTKMVESVGFKLEGEIEVENRKIYAKFRKNG
jgi:ubiquinone/menaquinone biosynthesis C-methylase UbiE